MKENLKMEKWKEKELYTMNQEDLLTRENGLRINFQDMEYFIIRIQFLLMEHLITMISTISKTFGSDMKVKFLFIIGNFKRDDKCGEGVLVLSNG